MKVTSGQDAAPPLADGRYRLLAVLGEGGQSVVYRAWDDRLGVWRAIKVLRPASARALRVRFETEARTLARLKHPNLLVVHDVGEDADRVYMVTGLAAESLADRLAREGPLAPTVACVVVRAVADGLVAAHAAGVVHRDIKPANILADTDGTPMLADFGIAQVAAERRTQTDVAMGTPLFMAPEQWDSAASADVRSDIYSLGATLYAAVVGHEPAGPVEELTDAALAGVPDPLRPVLRVATARDPARRYPSAAALSQALGGVLPRLPSVADPRWHPPDTGTSEAPAPSSLPTWVARPRTSRGTRTGGRRWLPLAVLALGGGGALAAAAVAVAAVALAGGLAWWTTRPAPPPTVTDIRPLTTYPPGIPLEMFGLSRDGSAVLYLDGATGLVWRHPLDGSTPRARLHPEVDEPRLAGYLGEDLLGFVDDEGQLSLRDLRTSTEVPFHHDGVQFELSPRGDQIAWHDGRSAFRAGADGGTAVPLLSVPEGQLIHGIAWSPDQTQLAFVVIGEHRRSDRQVRVVVADADGMLASRPVYTSGDVVFTDRIAPIAWPWPDAVLIVERASGQKQDHLVVVPLDGDPVAHLAALPVDVEQLVVRDATLAILGLRALQDTWAAGVGPDRRLVEPRLLWPDEDEDSPVGWLPDGSLAFRSTRFGVERLLAQRLDSPDVRVLSEAPVPAVAGGELVALQDDGRLVRAPVSEEVWRPPSVSHWDSLSCAADGTCVSCVRRGDRTDCLHYLPGETAGTVVARLPLMASPAVVVSPDGQRLAVLERATDEALLRTCDLPACTWQELVLPALGNPQGLAWRTDAPGWWIATAASKVRPEPVIAAIDPDGTLAGVTAFEGRSVRILPAPDGATVTFDLHRRDMDVWVGTIPR